MPNSLHAPVPDNMPGDGPQSSEAPIRADHVIVRYQEDLLAVDTVSFEVHAGEIYALLGAAGAGKTTLLHTLAGFVRPTAGVARVCGIDPSRSPIEARRMLTFVGKQAALYPTLTLRQNLEFFVRVDGCAQRLPRNDYYNALRRTGVPERYLERTAGSLGRAMSLAVWLAVGLMKETAVLLLDEPSIELDLLASTELQSALIEFRARGRALLVATSDVFLASVIADRVGIMKEGRKSVEIRREEIMRASLPQLYFQYMGRPYPTVAV